MTDDGIDPEELVEFLREERDNYEEMYKEHRVGGADYPYGRYHSYCDVLAWLHANYDIETDTEQEDSL